MSNMTIGTKGLNLIKTFEGLSLKYYTIGYGHSYDKSITAKTVWTQAQAEAQLKKDLQKFEGYVNANVPITLNQNQFDALVSYVYNRGQGGLKQLVANSTTAADYAKNIVVYWGTATRYKTGLIRRRKQEQALFLTQCVTTLRKGDSGEKVKLLQKRLATCDWNLKVDGTFGPKTESAVRGYQYKVGLVVDGVVGPRTNTKLLQDAIVARAKTISTYMIKHKWHYRGNGYIAKSTFATTKVLDKPGSSCAHFVSWVLQDEGLLQPGKILSHSAAGYGTGAKALVNANKLIDCAVTYPNAKLDDYKDRLYPGDVLIHDSSVGIWIGGGTILTAREGRPINSTKQYVDLAVTSGYEWKHDVLAIVRAA